MREYVVVVAATYVVLRVVVVAFCWLTVVVSRWL